MSWRFPAGLPHPGLHQHVSNQGQVHIVDAGSKPEVIMGIALEANVPLDNQNISKSAPNINTLRGVQAAQATGPFKAVTAPAIHVYAIPGEVMRQASPCEPWHTEEESNEGVMLGERLLYRKNIHVPDFYARNASKTQAGQEETFYCTKKGTGKCVFCRNPTKQPASKPPGNDVLIDNVST